MNNATQLFPQLKFHDITFIHTRRHGVDPKPNVTISPIITPFAMTSEYDSQTDEWYRSMNAIFTLSNSESVQAYWPVEPEDCGFFISLESFVNFCRVQATYLEAQLFKLGLDERVLSYTIHTKRPDPCQDDGKKTRYVYGVTRYTVEASIYRQVLRGQEISPYVMCVNR